MKKIGLVVKEISEKQIKTTLKDSGNFFIIKYSGLSSPDITSLRQSLKTSRANLFVVKNSVARRALKDSGLEAMVKAVEGPCGMIFVKDMPVEASKILCTFSKDHENLKLEGGFLEDRILEKKDIEAMAKLPSKDVLRAQVVMALNAPISKLVIVLNQNLRKIVVCLDQIKQKKEKVK
ncbi:MAG: 50S ribosomal protein L10 [Candidatus Omnitrophica bacterium]|jgi:large subunit ribosomal protein L10|nr:50S ribosomal protein L10 [Candidatus Omnitrophota bacterium]